jgi:hypothetical protein
VGVAGGAVTRRISFWGVTLSVVRRHQPIPLMWCRGSNDERLKQLPLSEWQQRSAAISPAIHYRRLKSRGYGRENKSRRELLGGRRSR